uniref:Omptin family outer membrane protease OmpT n=1 Tax=Steinernema glaseri TaxID=37863 RepID=A0A1I8APN1_9BILA
GYQFWDDELGAFSLGSLLNRTDYEYSDGGKDNFYSLGVKWDYNRYLIGKSVELFTNGEVTEWASLNLKAEKDIISGTSDSDLDKTRYTVGFGVAW